MWISLNRIGSTRSPNPKEERNSTSLEDGYLSLLIETGELQPFSRLATTTTDVPLAAEIRSGGLHHGSSWSEDVRASNAG